MKTPLLCFFHELIILKPTPTLKQEAFYTLPFSSVQLLFNGIGECSYSFSKTLLHLTLVSWCFRDNSNRKKKKSINMCSLLYAMNQLKSSKDGQVEWCNSLSFFVRLVAYVSVLAVIVVVILLILKYMTELGDGDSEPETDPVCPEKVIAITYGRCEDEVETGSCSSGEDLYDARICIICYDEQRNCFFVPCGHCATCYDCAQRIYEEENKVCPVCRRIIGKVRKLFAH